MKHLKRTGYIVTSMFLLFFAACGGDSPSTPRQSDPPAEPPLISISPMTASATVGGAPITFTVAPPNSGFSFSPPANSGCAANAGGNTITCAPTAAGTYSITVTAASGARGSAAATLTAAAAAEPVTPPVISSRVSDSLVSAADGLERKTVAFTFRNPWTASIEGLPSIAEPIAGSNERCIVDQGTRSGPASTAPVSVIVICHPNNTGEDIEFTLVISNSGGDGGRSEVALTQKITPSWGVDYTSIEVFDTAFYDINNNGHVAGAFYDGEGNAAAFLREGGEGGEGAVYSLINPPGAEGEVEIYGINDAGHILLYYNDRYFLKTGDVYQPLAGHPDAGGAGGAGEYFTHYTGISNSGRLSGYYTDDTHNRAVGFVTGTDGGFVLAVSHPDAASACGVHPRCGTWVNGINNAGQAAGEYRNSDGRYIGFVYDYEIGEFTVIDHPGGGSDNPISVGVGGINDIGHVVGWYWGYDLAARGFVWDGGRFIEIAHPLAGADGADSPSDDGDGGGAGVFIYGINNAGRLAGWFDGGGSARGFLMSR